MGKAEIIADLGGGNYSIKRVYAGRDAAQDKIVLLNTNIAKLLSQYTSMPEDTEDETFAKHIVGLQIASLRKQVAYIQNNFPDDIEVDAYCADYTKELSGEVGTIDIPGEVTDLINIRPGYDETALFDAERDGEFWPSIAVGPWTCFLNKCILPGWQKWYPKYRYGWIVPGSINYEDNTCAVTIQPAYSSQQNLDVNQDDGFGGEIVDEEREVSYFYQPSVSEYPGLQDFCERNFHHPICQNTEVGAPVELTDEQFEQIRLIQHYVNNSFEPESDQSGYGVGEYFDIMYVPGVDTGDCEDYALTKMHLIIDAGILPAKNLQLIFCNVIGEVDGGHAVAGIQTTNFGFIILDNRHDELMPKSALRNEYSWEAFQVAGTEIMKVQRLKGEVPIEYMSCNAWAFNDGDEVVVEFTGQDWTQPKVIGFKESPGGCFKGFCNMFGGYPFWVTAFRYTPATDTWAVSNGIAGADFIDLYSFYVPEYFNWINYAWDIPSEVMVYKDEEGNTRFPIVRRCEPMVTHRNGFIYTFGGWFTTGSYFPQKNPTAWSIYTCEKFNVTMGVWSKVNKDQYSGRSYGAAFVLGNKHHIIGGADYDNRVNTFYPHIDLDTTGYEYGDIECWNTPPGPGAVQQVWRPLFQWFGRDQDWHTYFGASRNSWASGVGEVPEGWVWSCTVFNDSGGAHSFPPSDGSGFAIQTYYSDGWNIYWWIGGNIKWGRRWYVNALFSENLQFDDVANSYSQKTATVATMMMAGFKVGESAYIAGGTTEEIADLICSADASGVTDAVREYQSSSDTWRSRKELPEKLLNPSGFSLNGKGYVFSGYSFVNPAGSTAQQFGREPIYLNLVNCHPESRVYRGGNVDRMAGVFTAEGLLAAKRQELYCTNNLSEYDPIANAWISKQQASTPTGNCRYREYFNRAGSVTDPFYYGFVRVDQEYQRDDGSFGICQYGWRMSRLVQEENRYTDHYELFNPGPELPDDFFVLSSGRARYQPTTQERQRKLQHLYRYPAVGHDGIGYLTSGEHVSTGFMEEGRDGIHIRVNQYMSAYDPLTDSHSIKSAGFKEHLSGGMVSI